MLNPYLEREKELMKLNESLNNKIPFDLKAKALIRKPVKAKPRTVTPSKTERCAKMPVKSVGDVKCKDVNKFSTSSSKKLTSTSNEEAIAKVELEKYYDEYDNFSESDRKLDQVKLTDEEKTAVEKVAQQANASSKQIEKTVTTIDKSKETEPNITEMSLIPQNFFRRNVSSEGIIKFLKAKVTILQQELDLSHKENTKNADKLAKVIEEQKKGEAARSQAINTINLLNSQIQKMQQSDANVALKLKETESIMQSQRKECEELKSKLKAAQQMNASLELRLNKYQEDLECIRKNYHATKNSEKELQLTLQHERTFYENQLKINQRNRNDLMAALKKHLLLLENLKRQNICLAQAKCIQITEAEFLKVFEWNADNGKK